jgi:hypothetical protein
MNLTQYNGMAVEEARAKAQAAGFEVKVQLPGMQTLNCEYRQGRLTFKVENGVVVGAEIG